jgi:hypothetical protein
MKNKNSGFVMQIILIIIALVLVKYIFHFDIVQWFQTPGPQKVLQTVWGYITDIYNWVDKTVQGLTKK